MNAHEVIQDASQYLMHTYKRDLLLVSGQGCTVFDSDGNSYLDLVGGIACCTIGHSNPTLLTYFKSQDHKLLNPSNHYYTAEQALLAKKLCALSGLGTCFFSNSGTEAVETAIKLARKHTGKKKIIAMEHAFHGRTLGSLSATWKLEIKAPFEPLVPLFVHVPYGDIKALEKELDTNTAAVILEPIQGEAGIVVPPPDYLKQVENLCKKHHALLILDEIQTGNGRTGSFFCYQQEGLYPDIVTLAKGLANGIPIGVTLSKAGIDFKPFEHGSTFGGNPFACGAALVTLEAIEALLPGVKKKGVYLKKKLEALHSPLIKGIRGKGLMLAIALACDAYKLKDACQKKGVLVNAVHKQAVRLLPPLTITLKEIDSAISKIALALKEVPHD
ncbi:acetylornithine/succinylornithine family transaminase [Candidatus Woesearchaeota archaeon]|nr:acetylornithine/succinylornithine family transaminase [Candidatus Woesearchaeota archaeon]